MAIDWENGFRSKFGKTITGASHTLDRSPLFCDASLAALLDVYPRDKLGIWTFAAHGEGEEAPVRGIAPDLSGEDLLRAVRTGRIWLNLRAANHHVPDYASIGTGIFDSLQAGSGHRVFKRDMGILISSPGVNVHYHLDIPMVALFQVRGEKTMWVYPPEEQFAPARTIEAIALREQEEGLPYRHAFESSAQRVTLKPGMAVSWPQMAPHRVQNGDMMNVSLSCEFMTMPALLRANALYTNAHLRRHFRADPARPERLGASLVGKAALARVLKKTHPPAPRAPTPATFTVDLTAEGFTRQLGEPVHA